MTAAWVIRSGRLGERDRVALESNLSGGGFEEFPDLTACTSRADVQAVAESATPEYSKGKLTNAVSQLWALRGRIKPGDLMAMPMKTTRQIALGRVTTGYRYLAENPPAMRHVVGVEWIRKDLPRTAVKQDLLYTLGSALTLFAPSKNNAVERLETLLETGVDPGAVDTLPPLSSHVPAADSELDSSVDSPELSTDFEQAVADQIRTRIGEDFAGHALADLVAAILTAEGLKCDVAPPGRDGGIDITAGRGPLGIDSPTVLVQVKSGGQVGDPVVSQLQGVVSRHGADQGLLVAWGGLTAPARDQVRNNRLRMRVWDAEDIVDGVLRNYHRLTADMQARLPLKQVWMLTNPDE